MLSGKQVKALQALLEYPTLKQAAKAAGVHERTIRKYLDDPEFQDAYAKECRKLIGAATRKMQIALAPAIQTLVDITSDEREAPQVRVNAARTLLEYGLRMTEITDILSIVEDA